MPVKVVNVGPCRFMVRVCAMIRTGFYSFWYLGFFALALVFINILSEIIVCVYMYVC